MEILGKNGISCEGQRAGLILHRASLDRVICFGVNRGKQETHVLFEEWVPDSKTIKREEALAELARRYFAAFGPATKQDYMWWSGLRASDANAGLEAILPELEQVSVEGKTYWMQPHASPENSETTVVRLLPMFDSFLIGYKDRVAAIGPAVSRQLRTDGMPDATILVDGKVAGTWKRQLRKDAVVMETALFSNLSNRAELGLKSAVERYGEFVGKKTYWKKQVKCS